MHMRLTLTSLACLLARLPVYLSMPGHDSSLHVADLTTLAPGTDPVVRTVRLQQLPLSSLLFLGESALVGAGHDFNPTVFTRTAAGEEWREIGRMGLLRLFTRRCEFVEFYSHPISQTHSYDMFHLRVCTFPVCFSIFQATGSFMRTWTSSPRP